jgi:hypothetical protein
VRGELISNNWILTLRECLRVPGLRVGQWVPADPGEVKVEMGSQSTVLKFIVVNPLNGMALGKLAKPMTMKTSPHEVKLHNSWEKAPSQFPNIPGVPEFPRMIPKVTNKYGSTSPTGYCYGYGDPRDLTRSFMEVSSVEVKPGLPNIDYLPTTNINITLLDYGNEVEAGDRGGGCYVGDELIGLVQWNPSWARKNTAGKGVAKLLAIAPSQAWIRSTMLLFAWK